MLEIPHLTSVPRTWTLHQQSRMTARAALSLLDAGHVPLTPLVSTPGDLVHMGLEHWLKQQAAGIRIFNFGLSYHDRGDKRQGTQLHPASVSVYLTSEGSHRIKIQRRVIELQRAVPGLGTTVLYWINTATALRIPIYTPTTAFDVCCWIHWAGCEDEKERLAEAKLNGEDPKDLDMITRADWDAKMPTWVSQPRPTIGRDRLTRLAKRRFPLSGKVARALLALFDTLDAAPMIEEHREQPVMPYALYLRWSDDDHMERVMDDYGEFLAQSGEYLEHIEWFEHCDNEELGPQLIAWLAHLQPYFTFIRALDELIVLLAPRPENLVDAFRGY
jgi:PRTRC genetic system protein F